MQKQKRENIRRAVFLIYLMLTIRLIIFKYPFADLKEIMDTWQSGVILRGLETANFRLFKTVRMYIVYRDRLNSFENLFGNFYSLRGASALGGFPLCSLVEGAC